jgi:hypothetical protein
MEPTTQVERRRTDRRKVAQFPEVVVVNDIGVILRIQGTTFPSLKIYEPVGLADLSISAQTAGKRQQLYAASLLGEHSAKAIRLWTDSKAELRVQRDKLLTFAWSGFSNTLRDETPRDIELGVGASLKSLDTTVTRRIFRETA